MTFVTGTKIAKTVCAKCGNADYNFEILSAFSEHFDIPDELANEILGWESIERPITNNVFAFGCQNKDEYCKNIGFNTMHYECAKEAGYNIYIDDELTRCNRYFYTCCK